MKRIVSSTFAVLVPTLLATGALAHAEESKPSVTWAGDVRFRNEWLRQEKASQSSVLQQRLMFRLGGKTKLDETADLEFRLASGTGRTTTNQTLGASNNAFGNYGIGVDRAYFDWHGFEGMSVLGGRTRNFLYVPGGSDLVWDSDLNLDGTGVTYKHSSGLFATAGLFWVDKSSSAALKDNLLVSAQLGAREQVGELNLAAGASLYGYTHAIGQPLIVTNGNGGGNSVSAGNYSHDYRVLDLGVEATLPLAELPVTLLGDFIRNSAVDTDNKGFLIGLKVGQAKKAHDWIVGWDFRKLERDSTISGFTDADSFDQGGTDGQGHRFKAGYQLTDHFFAAANLYLGKKLIADNETSLRRDKLQIDLTFQF